MRLECPADAEMECTPRPESSLNSRLGCKVICAAHVKIVAFVPTFGRRVRQHRGCQATTKGCSSLYRKAEVVQTELMLMPHGQWHAEQIRYPELPCRSG